MHGVRNGLGKTEKFKKMAFVYAFFNEDQESDIK
jgi:hypothetical protein